MIRTAVVAAVAAVTIGCGSGGSGDTGGYTAPDGPGDPFYYAAIQAQYDEGDCKALDTIIQGWRDPPPNRYADSYIAEANKAKDALGCR